MTAGQATEKLEYESHIDGLRAIAVIGVLFYHFEPFFLPGGYLGVDIFFVISGYLITKTILFDLQAGRFSYKRFYIKRAKRLLPALLVVVMGALACLWPFMSASELRDFSYSALSALFFSSNFWFYANTDYFATEAARNPLLHTWSLGIEEQFYIIFPFLLVLITSKFSQNTRILIILGLTILSLTGATLTAEAQPNFAFYMLPTRFWEFLIGAIVAIRPIKKLTPNWTSTVLLCAFSVFLFSFTTIDKTFNHPSLLTLLPVVATAAIIAYGGQNLLSLHVLANKPMVYVGKLSYTLYLVHYPIVSWMHLSHPEGNLSGFVVLGAVLACLIGSVCIHHALENPLRFGKTLRTLYVGLAMLSITIALVIFFLTSGSLEKRSHSIKEVFLGTAKEDRHLLKNGQKCYSNRAGKGCNFQSPENIRSMLLIGDSHAYAMGNAVKKVATELDANLLAINMTHCPYLPGAARKTGFKAKCTLAMQEQAREYLLSLEPSIIINVVRWPLYLNADNLDNGEGGVEDSLHYPFRVPLELRKTGQTITSMISDSYSELADHGHTVVLVYPIPEVGWHIPNLVRERIRHSSPAEQLERFDGLEITTNYDFYKDRSLSTFQAYDAIEHENIVRIYPENVFCSEATNRCKTHDKNGLYYMDDNHMSQYGAQLLGDEIEKELWNHINKGSTR